MKDRLILIEETGDGRRIAALLRGRRLDDLVVDTNSNAATPGAIFLAKVDRMVPAMGGAFLRLADDVQGFLREAKGLKPGATLRVQVTGQAEPDKAVPVTARPLLKGQCAILCPGAPGINISRAIRDEEIRARLRAVAEKAFGDADPGCGLILRTSAAHSSDTRIATEIAWLLEHWQTLAGTAVHAPCLIGGWPPHVRAAIDWAAQGATEGAAAGAGRLIYGTTATGGALDMLLDQPTGDTPVERFDGSDMLDHFGIWGEIERLQRADVTLPSGGSMFVEATRAMVTVDVNTGGGFSGGASMTANIEAARELPRQLRLRGLGGQIVVDFAPLKKMHRKKIEETLRTAFKACPVETSMAGWTPLGHFELQRKRERQPLAEVLRD